MTEFKEIAHSGGQIAFKYRRSQAGGWGYQVQISCLRPVPMVMIGIYALSPGIPVAQMKLGQGQEEPPPIPGCYPVFIQSDSEGKFGHHCPRCDGYWRSGPWPAVCPYCFLHAGGHEFLSKAQLDFVRQYCDELNRGSAAEQEHEVLIDMDKVADAAGIDGEKPPFYVSEQSQQHKFNCTACGEFNDILGRYGYCSRCGTRNDLAYFEDVVVPAIRDRLNTGASPEDCVRDSVSSVDSFISQYAKQFAALVPLTDRRINRLTKFRFYKLDDLRATFLMWFDIDVCEGMQDTECQLVARMMLRRHVYEHNGGEVDKKYLDDSGDTTVRLKQVIRETRENAHATVTAFVKMARNLHTGFHNIFKVEQWPIDEFATRKARIERTKVREPR